MILEKRVVRKLAIIAFLIALLLSILPVAFAVLMGYGGFPPTLKAWAQTLLFYFGTALKVFLIIGAILGCIASCFRFLNKK